MDDHPELRRTYKTFKKISEEAGGFFRQKEHYSLIEQIRFLTALHKSYIELEYVCDSNEDLKDGKTVTLSANGDFSRVTIDKKHILDEFETTVSVIYFNLVKEDIENLLDFCKANALPQEAHVIKRLFEKFLAD